MNDDKNDSIEQIEHLNQLEIENPKNFIRILILLSSISSIAGIYIILIILIDYKARSALAYPYGLVIGLLLLGGGLILLISIFIINHETLRPSQHIEP